MMSSTRPDLARPRLKKIVYLAGLISTTCPQSLEWRMQADVLLRDRFRVLSPMRGKESLALTTLDGGITDPSLTSKDIVLRDFNDVCQADVLLVALDTFGAPRPLIGTFFELAWAWDRRKPVIAFASDNNTLVRRHPFLVEAVAHFFTSLEEAAEFLNTQFA